MVLTRVCADNPDLVETYSTTGMCLLQQETDVVYGDSVVDIIDHYVDGVPYSRFTYIEVDEPIEDEDIPDAEALEIITGEHNETE